MNRILVSMGYGNTYLLPDMSPAEIGTLMSVLARAQRVESSGYGAERKVYSAGEHGFTTEVVHASVVVADDPSESLRAELAEAKRMINQREEWWSTERKRAEGFAQQIKDSADSSAKTEMVTP